MALTYYLDESGNTGDLVKVGDRVSFSDQPIFVLACVGVPDEKSLASKLDELRSRFNVRRPELKASNLFEKPWFTAELVRFLGRSNAPVLMEAMEKRYTICMHLVERLVLPRSSDSELEWDSQPLRNRTVEYLRANMPVDGFRAYAEACAAPSGESVREVFGVLINWLKELPADDFEGAGVRRYVQTSAEQFESEGDRPAAHQRFLPVADPGNPARPTWMLPNVTALANIYARLNLLHRRNLRGVTLVHDDQLEFAHILKEVIATMDSFGDRADALPVPFADFGLMQSATFKFASSRDTLGVQVADLLAGFVMRYAKAVGLDETALSDSYNEAFYEICCLAYPEVGLGTNWVLSDAAFDRMGLRRA